ncbi:hypothetical protein JS533_001690 [Bifidobacterium amazonense]|uniref:Phage protein n=1 Tax=Bifidobacterium amazonense TaxID=2809027 RepID=A0ABS9VSR7_9BIFI|nr:hypothetical protein [Bifidobacterium amazonense]MCH9275001.1 hypothetical protein [Bifidobacterium amazonense]
MAVNAEKLVMDWLNADPSIKDSYPARFDVPAESTASHPIPFITVEQVGGADEPFRNLPLIAVQVWGESRWLVSEAASRLVVPRLKRIIERPSVAAVELTGRTHFPMPDGRSRYQILVQLVVESGDLF